MDEFLGANEIDDMTNSKYNIRAVITRSDDNSDNTFFRLESIYLSLESRV